MHKIILLWIWVILASSAFGQNKFEKEDRMKEQMVPETAKSFVLFDGLKTKVRWYLEENLEGYSIEAKLKYDGKRYSIEFDTSGVFQDIEIEAVFGGLTLNTGMKITEELGSSFSKYKVQRLQHQYSGNIPSFSSFLYSLETRNEYILKYEIVVKGKTEDGWNLYELLFDQDGALEKRSRIIFRNTDNLEF
ncbi:MAG: hypothetical protein V2I47_11605 [Bacteroidales bacterium]|nr:hypothetical protein [Bacteroidales bacterium]